MIKRGSCSYPSLISRSRISAWWRVRLLIAAAWLLDVPYDPSLQTQHIAPLSSLTILLAAARYRGSQTTAATEAWHTSLIHDFPGYIGPKEHTFRATTLQSAALRLPFGRQQDVRLSSLEHYLNLTHRSTLIRSHSCCVIISGAQPQLWKIVTLHCNTKFSETWLQNEWCIECCMHLRTLIRRPSSCLMCDFLTKSDWVCIGYNSIHVWALQNKANYYFKIKEMLV